MTNLESQRRISGADRSSLFGCIASRIAAARYSHPQHEPKDEEYSFEEYQMYYESTEKVIDRRLEFSRWYFSVCVAALIAIATLSSWAITKPSFVLPAIAMDAVLAFIGAFFCTLWSGQVSDSKLLNNAKFEVLNAMAPKVKFSNNAVSARPFEQEWKLLQSQKATSESGKIIVLRSSYIETLLPRAIGFIFLVILFSSLVTCVFNWRGFSAAVLTVPQGASKP